jgi:adenine-specific DNA methylase
MLQDLSFYEMASEFLPQRLSEGYHIKITPSPVFQPDLFGRSAYATSNSQQNLPTIRFDVGDRVQVLVNTSKVRPFVMKAFLTVVSEALDSALDTFGDYELDYSRSLSVSGFLSPQTAERLSQIWRSIIVGNRLERDDEAILPKLYGSKSRIVDFVNTVALAVIQPGAPVLDLMSGTGIITRILSRNFRTTANDANPYAVTFTRAQTLPLECNVDDLLGDITTAARVNAAILEVAVDDQIAIETGFFNGLIDEEQRRLYQEFCAKPIFNEKTERLPAIDGYHLCLHQYANVYFGVAQAIEIDSIRAAIDTVTPDGSSEREICLAALLYAMTVCTTGPHFAQPLKVTSVSIFKRFTERRARSVLWEFELTLRRIAARQSDRPVSLTTQLDWRQALERFARDHTGQGQIAVYVDPPYSKLQYSRYYHVLNTIIDYKYPSVSGVGKYPPMKTRFSSRFENRAATALSEFDTLIQAASTHRSTLLVSYSDTGFVPIDQLIEKMKSRYAVVDVFTETIRHHNQGRATTSKGNAVEYILAGRDPIKATT